jgi:hypothetical protein
MTRITQLMATTERMAGHDAGACRKMQARYATEVAHTWRDNEWGVEVWPIHAYNCSALSGRQCSRTWKICKECLRGRLPSRDGGHASELFWGVTCQGSCRITWGNAEGMLRPQDCKFSFFFSRGSFELNSGSLYRIAVQISNFIVLCLTTLAIYIFPSCAS